MPILIVEDEAEIRFLISELLSDEGYTVVQAIDGRAALAYLHTAPDLPRLIILDLVMPIMNGWDFLRARQDDPIVRAIPVIVVSATPNIEVSLAALGAQEALSKPIDLDRLVALVQQHRASALPHERVARREPHEYPRNDSGGGG
jgi:CheY-like chemotaxis protein